MQGRARVVDASVVMRWAALALACTAWRCAHMEPPSGGPVDTKAPSVVAVYPSPGARHVPLDAPVVLQYSEWIDRNAARTQAFVSPPVRGKLRVVAEGDKLQVQPSEAAGGWRPNTTYLVTVLPTLQDLHGVKSGRRFTLRFSTGAELDVASAEGKVSSAEPKGVPMAALYRSGNRSGVEPLSARAASFSPAPTPEPWRELPAHLALPDSAGAFRFDSVAQGEYALFAFEDVNGNFTYDYGFENAAVGPLSLALNPRAENQALRVAPADTLPLRVSSASFVADSSRDSTAPALAVGKIRVDFSRAPHPGRAAEAVRYRILPDSGAPLPVVSAAWSPLDGAWMLDAGPLRTGREYRVEMRARPDFPGRDGGADTSVSFTAGDARDTLDWRFGFVETAAATGLSRPSGPAVSGREFTVASNRPLVPARWKLLNDRLEARIDSAPAPRTLSLVSNFTFSLKLAKPAPAGKALELRLRPLPGDSSFKPLASLPIADSTQSGGLRFTPPARYAGWVFQVENPDKGSYRVPSESLPAGVYRLSGFLDKDKDGVWNPGSLKPWVPQEPFARLLDSVAVKPGTAVDITPRLESARK